MRDERLTHRVLRREVLKQAVAHVVLTGPGAPLCFLWILGAGLLLTVFDERLLALLLSAVFAAIAAFMVRDCLANRERRTAVLRLIVDRRVHADQLGDPSLRETVRKGTDVFVELSVKTLEIVGAHGEAEDLGRVLGDASEMLAWQLESARRVTEYRRVLALIEPTRHGHEGRGRPDRLADGEPTLRDENLATVERSAIAEERLVAEVGEKLDTLMLQILQMERRATDLVAAAQFAAESSDTLRSLEALVTARRETAETIRRIVSPTLG